MNRAPLIILALACLAYAAAAIGASDTVSKTGVLLCVIALAFVLLPLGLWVTSRVRRRRQAHQEEVEAFMPGKPSVSVGDLVSAARIARSRLPGGTTVAELAAQVMEPLATAHNAGRDRVLLLTMNPARIIGAGRMQEPGPYVDLDGLQGRVFASPGQIIERRSIEHSPEDEALARMFDRLGVAALVPCADQGVVECVFALAHPFGSARPIRDVEATALLELGRDVAQVVSLIQSRDRLQARSSDLMSQLSDALAVQTNATTLRDRAAAEATLLRSATVDAHVLAIEAGQSAPLRSFVRMAADSLARTGCLFVPGPPGMPTGAFAVVAHRASEASDGPCLRVDASGVEDNVLRALLFGDSDLKGGLLRDAIGGTVVVEHLAASSRAVQEDLSGWLAEWDATLGRRPQLVATGAQPFAVLLDRGAVDPCLESVFQDSEVPVPSLCACADDIAMFAQEVVSRLAKQSGQLQYDIDADAGRWLATQTWPGNLAELEGVLHHAFAQSSCVELRHLTPRTHATPAEPPDARRKR